MLNGNVLKRFIRNTDGGTAIAFIAGSVAMITAVGAAVDLSMLSKTHQGMQAALDASVLASGHQTSLSADDLNAYGRTAFVQNLEDGAPEGLRFSVTFDGSSRVTGIATADRPLIFASFLGASSKPVSVKSEITLSASGSGETSSAGVPCISILGDGKRTLTMNSDAVINAVGCEVHIHTDGEPGLSHQSHASLTADRVCLSASTVLNNGDPIENLEKDCAVDPDPFAGVYPQADSACTFFGENHNGGTVNLTPGVYCGSRNFNGSPTVNLAPGTYVIKDRTWNVNGGTWNGEGVTIYFLERGAKIQFNSDVNVNLTAPSSGDYSGVVMMESDGLTKSNFILNPSESFDVEGLIYLPSRNMTLNSQSQINGRRLNLVVNELMINGASLNIVPVETYPPTVTGSSSLAQIFTPRVDG